MKKPDSRRLVQVLVGVLAAAALVGCGRTRSRSSGPVGEVPSRPVGSTPAVYQDEVDEGVGAAIMILVDTSGSMAKMAPGDGRPKFEVGRSALAKMLDATTSIVNRRVLEALIRCGACDSLGETRASLFARVERALARGASVAADRERGQSSLFGLLEETAPTLPDRNGGLPGWPQQELLAAEKELLGFYVTGHPLTPHVLLLEKYALSNSRAILLLDQFGRPRGLMDRARGVEYFRRDGSAGTGGGVQWFLAWGPEDTTSATGSWGMSTAFAPTVTGIDAAGGEGWRFSRTRDGVTMHTEWSLSLDSNGDPEVRMSGWTEGTHSSGEGLHYGEIFLDPLAHIAGNCRRQFGRRRFNS